MRLPDMAVGVLFRAGAGIDVGADASARISTSGNANGDTGSTHPDGSDSLGMIEANVATLQRWASRDHERCSAAVRSVRTACKQAIGRTGWVRSTGVVGRIVGTGLGVGLVVAALFARLRNDDWLIFAITICAAIVAMILSWGLRAYSREGAELRARGKAIARWLARTQPDSRRGRVKRDDRAGHVWRANRPLDDKGNATVGLDDMTGVSGSGQIDFASSTGTVPVSYESSGIARPIVTYHVMTQTRAEGLLLDAVALGIDEQAIRDFAARMVDTDVLPPDHPLVWWCRKHGRSHIPAMSMKTTYEFCATYDGGKSRKA